jgi:hypothetical protein
MELSNYLLGIGISRETTVKVLPEESVRGEIN